MYKSQIRDEAEAAILKEHPELIGLVSFDIEFLTASSFMCGFDLIINLHGPDAWQTLQERTGRAGKGNDFTNLDGVLDHYRVTEATQHFVFMKAKWLIGDGDDHGALRTEGHTARLWVRTWWEEA